MSSPEADVEQSRVALLSKYGPGLPYGHDMILHFVDKALRLPPDCHSALVPFVLGKFDDPRLSADDELREIHAARNDILSHFRQTLPAPSLPVFP